MTKSAWADMQKSDRPSPITTRRPLPGRPWEHLQLAPLERQSARAFGNSRRQRSPPCHSSLLAKDRIDSSARLRTDCTTRSKPSETTVTLTPWRRQKLRKIGDPGSICILRISSSSTSGVTRKRATWRSMHSREEICPACHASSMLRQVGSANRSRRRSVGSFGAIVPSKSTRT